MKLPQRLTLEQLQVRWATLIEPFLNNPSSNPVLLKDIQLKSGPNSVNHRLGRKLQGWTITRLRSSAIIYDEQDSNPTPQLTLLLQSDNDCVVDLAVF